MRALVPLALLTATLPAAAETWRCAGEDPPWRLPVDAARAEFTLVATTAMEVMQQNSAENRDTAIVIVEPLVCGTGGAEHPYRALVRTRRGQTPILPAGCCGAPE